MLDNHDGGCLCGKVRYTVYGQPVRAGVCHCRYCQLRAGSAFGTLVYFSLEKLQIRSGKLSEYHFRTEMGRTWKNEFCSTCGTTLFMYLEAWPGDVGLLEEHLIRLLFGLNFQEKYLRDRKRIL